ncbi:hypothetical protein ACA30_22220 [Virgibacillus soli]|nr:hypothetical protein ACA30_22220 [Virgibacillus soli]
MKKANIFLLTIMLFLGVMLTACSSDANSKSDDGKTKLTFTMWGGESDKETYQERLDLAKEKFPDIDVELIYIPKEYAQKVQTMIAGNTAPDIMQLAEEVHIYSSKNQLAPLNEFIESAEIDLDARFGSVYNNYSREGNVYALPDRGGSIIVYYNKDLFDEAGVEYPTEDWTWDDLLAASQKLTKKDGDKIVQWGVGVGDWWPLWMSFMYQNGGGILDEDGNPIINAPENIEAMQFAVDLIHKYQVAPSNKDYANMGDIGADQLFAQGKLAIDYTGFWNIGGASEVEDLNWDIAPLWKNKEKGTIPFGSGLAITNQSKHKEEAFKIIEFLTGEEGQLPIVENNQDAPANVAVLESDTFLEKDFAKHPINTDTFAKSAEMIIEMPLIPEWNEMQKLFTDNFADVWTNNGSVEDALNKTQQDLEKLLKK